MSKLISLYKLVPDSAGVKIGRALLHTKAQSPHILFGAGIVGFVGTVYLSSRATLRVDEVIEKAQMDANNAKAVYENKEISEKHGYTEDDYLKDRVYIYTRTFVDIAKLYGPAIVVGGLTIAALTKSHLILNSRLGAVTAAYAGLERAYREYRRRVESEYGEEADRDFHLGLSNATITTHNTDTGEVEHLKVKRSLGYSPYARFFDEYSPRWDKNAEYNWLLLRAQQNYANDLLQSRGHLFLNEVYDLLGIDRSQAGAVVGWVISKDGDNYVDFGIFDSGNDKARDFVNGRESAILLDFNVDGVIYDKI